LSESAPFALQSFLIVFIIDFNVIIFVGVTWVKGNQSSSFNSLLFDDIIEHGNSSIVKFFGLLTNGLIVEDFWVSSVWVLSSDLPGDEEWIPINIFDQRS